MLNFIEPKGKKRDLEGFSVYYIQHTPEDFDWLLKDLRLAFGRFYFFQLSDTKMWVVIKATLPQLDKRDPILFAVESSYSNPIDIAKAEKDPWLVEG